MSSTSSPREEFRIIRDILDGNRDQFRVLVDRYSPMVFHLVRGFEQNEQDVKDLAQEIFVKAYERLSSFGGTAKFSSWLYSIAMNHCRDYAKNVRRKNKRFSEMENYEVEAGMEPQEAADQKLLREESQQRLKDAIEQLQPDYAEPLLLKYQDGLTYEAMSRRLGVTVSALKVRVHRARKEVKELMEKQS